MSYCLGLLKRFFLSSLWVLIGVISFFSLYSFILVNADDETDGRSERTHAEKFLKKTQGINNPDGNNDDSSGNKDKLNSDNNKDDSTVDNSSAIQNRDDTLHHIYSNLKSTKVGGLTLDEIIEAADLNKFTYIKPRNIKKISEKIILMFKGYTFRKFANLYNQGGLVITKPGGRVFICFKGTKNINDALIDLKLFWKDDSQMKGSFHRGFLALFRELYPQIRLHLEGIAKERGVKIRDLDILVVGHSMGAGLAQLTTKQLVEIENIKNIHGVYIAPPKTMDYTASTHFNEIIGPNTVSIIQDFYDIIPKIGPIIFGGYHVGERLVIPKLSKDPIHRLSSYTNALKVLRFHQNENGWNAKYVHMGDKESFRKVYKFKASKN